ncbi:protein-S-isoprenylcysteine O-methyltransferase Ste14 [Bradyrhizobium sp. CIR18]|nr:protein-S-isoprenylcysteine O-methyltransferase Ste14 [Bradyrhizobium sp. CIR18]
MPINKMPDFPSYFGYWLLWLVAGFVVWLFSIALFWSGHWIIGVMAILATIAVYFRHGMAIAKQRERWLRFSYGPRYRRYSLRERFGTGSPFRPHNES